MRTASFDGIKWLCAFSLEFPKSENEHCEVSSKLQLHGGKWLRWLGRDVMLESPIEEFFAWKACL